MLPPSPADAVMVYILGAGSVTVKLTVNDSEILFPPETVTTAVYSPAASPVTGTTVNWVLPLTAILERVGALSWKLVVSLPESWIVSSPVGWLPVFATVTS